MQIDTLCLFCNRAEKSRYKPAAGRVFVCSDCTMMFLSMSGEKLKSLNFEANEKKNMSQNRAIRCFLKE